MQVSDPNNVKIYNLSAGKSLPEWLSDRKKRALLKKDVDVRRRIELIQDFEMPGVSTSIKVSKDGEYILATGIYKPRVRCYDVNNLSMKFERCFDSEVVTFEILSEDYSKLVFLHCDRYVEFHAAHGRYCRLRIPKFGRDMAYHDTTCDLYLVGASHEAYRLNLERGQFLAPLQTEASEINVVKTNDYHHLILLGTTEGKVEAWDPRSRSRVGILDVALPCIASGTERTPLFGPILPSVTCMAFDGPLTLGVGSASGQVLLYDLRSSKPRLVKDHMYGIPIRSIAFHHGGPAGEFDSSGSMVLSMDANILKIWNSDTGKLFTSIESDVEYNSLQHVPNTGMVFIANEQPKILTYYIPSLGPAPKWCCFLDNLTEEMEENVSDVVYDDYKFVTHKELEELNLSHLLGTNLLRAYMHGFFMDVRLYRKALSIADPFAFERYKKQKIKEKIDLERKNRVQLKKLPQVNKELALKLMDEENKRKLKLEEGKKVKPGSNLLQDNRFKALFENPDFEVDKNADEYRLLNPVVSKLDRQRKKQLEKQIEQQAKFDEVEDEDEGKASSDEDNYILNNESSSEDDQEWTQEVKKQHRLIQLEKRRGWKEENDEDSEENDDIKPETSRPKFYAIRPGEEFDGLPSVRSSVKKRTKMAKISLGERVKKDEDSGRVKLLGSVGSREMTFTLGKEKKKRKNREALKAHQEERRKIRRSAGSVLAKLKPKFWMGRRVL
ncbi:nucleolar protein 10 [Hetaerina americana]|uniref:nucleolar protein 10 n=1 Tax=Hetaerina americana TaxID=62018 RepID=UPI003A7F557A